VLIETERLLLRRLVMADLDEFLALHRDPEVVRFVHALDRTQAEERLRASEQEWGERGQVRDVSCTSVEASPTVRPATSADAERIARVHVDSWRAGYRGLLAEELLAQLSVAERELMWRRRLTGEDEQHIGRRVDVAVARGVVVGFVVTGPTLGEDKAPTQDKAATQSGEIYAIYVHPDHWSAGVGQALVRSAVDHLAAIGATQAQLWVLASNARARRFYELAGWTCDGTTRTTRLAGLPDFASEVEEACYRRLLT
jgi:ribosomal protein S18 acetylase RimI-like enzyme